MDDRAEMMKWHGITTCPRWCNQSDEEYANESHVSDWVELPIDDDGVFRARALVSWWEEGDDYVQIESTLEQTTLSASEAAALRQLIENAEDLLGDEDNVKWAYPGAEEDAAAAAAEDDDDE